jgi:hypothetical protein
MPQVKPQRLFLNPPGRPLLPLKPFPSLLISRNNPRLHCTPGLCPDARHKKLPTISLSTISLPTISLPKIRLPAIRLPMTRLPTTRLPTTRLPTIRLRTINRLLSL